MDWRHRAVCREEDPELFFPVGNSGPAVLQIAEAKAVCCRCPVASECLAWALESGQDAGVWGGMSEDERRALKRRSTRSETAEKSETGEVNEPTPEQVEEILDLLDSGDRLPAVEEKTQVGREVCRQVWLAHRSNKNPPGHLYSRAQLIERGIVREPLA